MLACNVTTREMNDGRLKGTSHSRVAYVVTVWVNASRRHRCMLAMPLGPVHTSNNVEATLSNATTRTILSTKLNVDSNEFFETVEINWTFSICFDFVERIVRLVAFDNVASTSLLRKCCWWGLGFSWQTFYTNYAVTLQRSTHDMQMIVIYLSVFFWLSTKWMLRDAPLAVSPARVRNSSSIVDRPIRN